MTQAPLKAAVAREADGRRASAYFYAALLAVAALVITLLATR